MGSQLQGVSLEALKQKGLVTILSEPNLTARFGDKARFLAGGRFPYQTWVSETETKVVFEPYGVELEFQPEVMRSNKIKLEVDTKVRELDFAGGSETGVQQLPLILEHSAATTIEVGSGQSFAIASLFKATSQQTVEDVPGLGDIPLLGALFRSTSYQSGESELVIIVTPYLVEPGSPKNFHTPVEGFASADTLRRHLNGQLSVEGLGEITMRHLFRNSLRMRPDRIIIGEVRGDEAFDLLQAMNTGHDGSMSTLHANSPREALTRLENMIAMSGIALPVAFIRQQMKDAIHLVVQIARMRDGVRRVSSISEIVGMGGDTVSIQELFRFQAEPGQGGDAVVGRFMATGAGPLFMPRAAEMGLEAALRQTLEG